MWMIILLLAIVAILGLVAIAIHEYGHYRKFQEQGIPIRSISFLGWINGSAAVISGGASHTYAWVEIPPAYHITTWHENWDRCWKLNLTACGGLG